MRPLLAVTCALASLGLLWLATNVSPLWWAVLGVELTVMIGFVLSGKQDVS